MFWTHDHRDSLGAVLAGLNEFTWPFNSHDSEVIEAAATHELVKRLERSLLVEVVCDVCLSYVVMHPSDLSKTFRRARAWPILATLCFEREAPSRQSIFCFCQNT